MFGIFKRIMGFLFSAIIIIVFINMLIVLYIDETTKHPIEKDKKIYSHYNQIESFINTIFHTKFNLVPQITDDEIWTKVIMEELKGQVPGKPEIKIKKVIEDTEGKVIVYYDFIKIVKLISSESYVFEAEMIVDYEKDEIRTVFSVVEE